MGILETALDNFDESGDRVKLPESLRKITLVEAEPSVTSSMSFLFYIAKICFNANKQQEILKFYMLPEMIYEITKNIINDNDRLYLSFLSHSLDYLLSFNDSPHAVYLVTKMEEILKKHPNDFIEFHAPFLTYKRCLSHDDSEIVDYIHKAFDALDDSSQNYSSRHLISFFNLGIHHLNNNNLHLAKKYFDDCHTIAKKCELEESFEAIKAEYHLARIHYHDKCFSPARNKLHTVIQMLFDFFPAQKIDIALAFELMGFVNFRLKNHENGIFYINNALMIYRSKLNAKEYNDAYMRISSELHEICCDNPQTLNAIATIHNFVYSLEGTIPNS